LRYKKIHLTNYQNRNISSKETINTSILGFCIDYKFHFYKMKNKILFSFFLFIGFQIQAQNERVGDWVDYLPYHKVFAVAEGPEVVYGATANGLIEFNKSDKSVTRLSKAMGLSNVGISCLGYNELAETFFVGYSNGTIDLITSDRIITISDLAKKTISGNKSLNNLFMDSVFAYVATGFGIIKFNMVRHEFSETYLVAKDGDYIVVNDVTIANDTIYAATVKGVRMAFKDDPQITFYESWKTDLTIPFPNASYDIISSYNNTLYLNYPSEDTIDDILYQKFPNSNWTEINGLVSSENRSVEAYNGKVLIAHKTEVSTYDKDWNEIDRVFDYGKGMTVDALTAMIGYDSAIWIGDRSTGMVSNPKPFWFEIINPQSPAKTTVDEIDIRNNQIAIAAGLKQNNWTNSYNNNGFFYRNTSHEWGQTNKFIDDGLDGIFDLVTVQINPSNQNVVYAGSLGGGLVEFTDNKVSRVFNSSNSTLKNANSIQWVIVTGLDYDSQGNLWVANSLNSSAISVFTNDEKWIGYEFPQYVPEDKTGDIIVDKNGYKWVILPHGGKGILIFNDNNTLDDKTDDQAKILNSGTGTGGLPSSDVYSIAEDKDGEIWVGTSEGVGIFYSPTSIFSEGVNYDAQRIIVEVNGYYQYLLGTETVTAIAIDGADRKWFGTKGSGVFLMSADGTTELLHFTAENSPLLSNFIRTIKINETTGEVMIGTDDGIIAYKGTATDEETILSDAYAYPNPVPQNYYGPIAIKGLPANAEVRITDIAGNMVFTTRAEGTQAVWNGNDMNGQRVGTGVYLVFGIDVDGNESRVAKILFTQ